MTLHKSMWKAAVLMGIAGVLVFAGGAFAKEPNQAYKVTCGEVSAEYGSSLADDLPALLKEKCTIYGDVNAGTTRDTLWKAASGSGNNAQPAGPVASSSAKPKDGNDGEGAFVFALTNLGGKTLVSWDATKTDSFTLTVTIVPSKFDKGDNSQTNALAATSATPTAKPVIKSAKIAGGDLATRVHALYTWTSLTTTWLTNSGRSFVVGTNLADLELPTIPLKTGLTETSKNGKIYYRFVGTPSAPYDTRALDTTAVPILPGTYDIYVSFGGSKTAADNSFNNDSTAIKGTTDGTDRVKLTSNGKQLTIAYQTQADWAVLRRGDTTLTYSASPTWTLRAPGIDALVGTADTVIYTASVTGGSGTTASGEVYSAANNTAVGAATVKVSGNKGATFEFKIGTVAAGTVLVGGYTVTTTIIGKDAAGKYTWRITPYTFDVVILPKPLTSNDITVTVNGDGTNAYTYTGGNQWMSVTVKDGSRALTQSDTLSNNAFDAKDFAVNRKVTNATTLANIEGLSEIKRVNAGTASVLVEGMGNYKGIVEKTFTIQPKGISYALKTSTVDNATVEHKSGKVYDGTTSLGDSAFLNDGYDNDGNAAAAFDSKRNPFGGVDLTFSTLVGDEKLVANVDYTFTTKRLSSATVGTGRTATIAITLDTGSTVAKNYKLNTANITVSGITITKRNPANDKSHDDPDSAYRETFKYSIPTHYFWGEDNAARRGIGSVTYQNGMTNPGAKPIRVVYSYPGKDASDAAVAADFLGPKPANGSAVTFVGDTTRAPRLPGIYSVKVIIEDSSSTRTAQHIDKSTWDNSEEVFTTYVLGDYTILPPAEPTFADNGDLPAAKSVRTSRSVTLKVTALPFNYAAEGVAPVLGTLSYQWYRGTLADDETTVLSSVKVGTNSASYEATVTDSVTPVAYWVEVSNGHSTIQSTAKGKITSTVCIVSPLPPPQAIPGRVVVTLPDSVVYNGTNQTFVTTGDTPELTVAFRTITVGEDGTRDTTDTPLTEQAAGEDGELAGDYRLVYSANRNVGTANILVVGTDAYTGTVAATFKIVKRTLTALDLAFVDKRPYTGEALGANVRPVIENETGMGAITVTYNGQAAVPVEQGVYNLSVSVAAGANYTAASNLSLGAYEIGMGVLDSSCFKFETMQRLLSDPNLSKGIGSVTFVKGTGFGDSIIITYEGMRDVPTEKGEYEVYARILGGVNYAAGNAHLGLYKIVDKIAVAETDRQVPKTDVTEVVTIAPLPVKPAVALTAGPSPVKLGGEIKFFSKSVKSAIYIFDANGSSVAKLSAKPGKDGAVAVWNLKDKKGVAVSEGTYVAVAKAGSEKVSFRFSVVK